MERAGSDSRDSLDPDLVFDLLIKEVRRRVTHQGLDEIVLPPTSSDFSKKKLGVMWKGTLTLTNGKFYGLQTIHRVGEARLSFSQNIELTFTVDLSLTNPKICYDFQLTMTNPMNKEMEGVVTGIITSITFNVVVAVNVFTRKVRVVVFHFTEIGDIETEVIGLGTVFDFFASKAANVAVNRMKQEIAAEVEEQLHSILRDVFENTQWPIPDLPGFIMKHAKPFQNL